MTYLARIAVRRSAAPAPAAAATVRGVAVIDFTQAVDLSPAQAWARLTDFARHSDYVAFTRVRLIDPTAPGGGGFIARTEIGRFGFDDVNVLEIWRPPTADVAGLCQVRKAGRPVGGWARLEVGTRPDGGSTVRWQESITVRGLPALAAPVIKLVATPLFSRVVRKLMAD